MRKRTILLTGLGASLDDTMVLERGRLHCPIGGGEEELVSLVRELEKVKDDIREPAASGAILRRL